MSEERKERPLPNTHWASHYGIKPGTSYKDLCKMHYEAADHARYFRMQAEQLERVVDARNFDLRQANFSASSLETALRTVTRERDEQKALVGAKDEALRWATQHLDDSYLNGCPIAEALSLTPSDALKRKEAKDRLCKAVDDWERTGAVAFDTDILPALREWRRLCKDAAPEVDKP